MKVPYAAQAQRSGVSAFVSGLLTTVNIPALVQVACLGNCV